MTAVHDYPVHVEASIDHALVVPPPTAGSAASLLASQTPPAQAETGSRWTGPRIVSGVIGSVLVVAGLGAAGAGVTVPALIGIAVGLLIAGMVLVTAGSPLVVPAVRRATGERS